MAQSKGDLNDNIQVYIRKSQWKKALGELEKLYALDKGDPQVTLRMGDMCIKINDKDSAAKNYVKTASMFVKLGHVPKALATYKMILRIDPSLTGIQDKIDELLANTSNAAPASINKKDLKVDLKKAIPGLDEAAMSFPEPLPVKEPDDSPVYELNISSPAGGRTIELEQGDGPTFEIETGGGGGYGAMAPSPVSEGKKPVASAGGGGSIDLSPVSGELEFETGGISGGGAGSGDDGQPGSYGMMELDNGRADQAPLAGGVTLDPATDVADLDPPAGGGVVLEPDTDIPGMDAPYEVPEISPSSFSLNTSDVYNEPAFDEGATEEILAPPAPPADAAVETDEAEEAPAPKSGAIPLLFDLSHEETWDLLSKMKRLTFDTDIPVVREGEQGDALYIIRKGGVRVVTKMGEKEVVLANLGERDFFGEVSFLTGRPRTADIIANEPSEIMELSREDLDAVIRKHPKVAGVLKMFHESRVADTVASIKAVAKNFFK